jgi:uncharacterized tellurite resistance protein B-like protein
MIKRLFAKVAEAISNPGDAADDAVQREAALRMATAVLMVDVARADHDFDEDEFDRLLKLLESHLNLSADDALELVNVANDKVDELVSLHEFTALLHENLDEDEKSRIVGLLWQIAYADGRLHRYEDSLVLRISDLLYVSRGRVMRLKNDAKLAAG